MIHHKRFGFRISTLTLACLVAMPGIAMADEAREQALEQRINDLEKQLQSLAAEIRAQREAPPPAAPALPAGKLPIQLTTLTPGSPAGTTVKIGGFIKADFMATKAHDGQLADAASGRILYVPGQTPVGGSSSDVDYDAHAKFSRFNIGIDNVSDSGDKAGAFLEMDFFGNALGNQTSTNTYGVTVRHAYAYWNNWLAGQTWSNFMDTSALPDSVDFIGPTDGVVFVRQAQVRYTTGGFSASLENPETTVIPNGGGGATASDRGAVPDLTLRYGWKGSWGTFGIGALFRSLDIDRAATSSAPAISDSEGAFAFTVGGKWVLGSNDDLRYQVTAGDGMSRYIGLGVTGDAALSADGNLDAIGGFAGYLAWRHVFSSQLRMNLIYARSQYDNPIDLTGTAVNESVQSFRANIFYSPIPKLDVGIELMRAKRELESGVDGSLTRLQFTTKYSF
ncbi:MAG: DcaP family trimeric outer membrane transporter [Dokdonella sp.]|nr:carbohydrate porin [Dokdonella sp.]MCB1574630.1 carbohydrate porin [Xanthomonadales bacterium]